MCVVPWSIVVNEHLLFLNSLVIDTFYNCNP